MANERKHAHMTMIQAVVTRLATNSFQLKGWAVVVVSALYSLSAANKEAGFVYVAFLPVVAFWTLDAYFLHQERLFRKLYDHVRVLDDADIDYSMNTQPFRSQVTSVVAVGLSMTLLWFYGALLVTTAVVSIVQSR